MMTAEEIKTETIQNPQDVALALVYVDKAIGGHGRTPALKEAIASLGDKIHAMLDGSMKTLENADLVVKALIEAEDYVNDLDGAKIPKCRKLLHRALRSTGRYLMDKGYGLRGWLTIDVWVVAIDETEYWTLKPEDMALIERIETVYMFDRNTVTYLCSPDKNYWMIPVEQRAIFKDGVSDHDIDRIDMIIMDNLPSDADYMGDRGIDRMIEKNDRSKVYHYGNPGLDLDEAEANTVL